MDGATLTRAIADLAAIEAAGLLPDLLADVAAERRGWPASDLRRYPLHAPMVNQMANHAAQLFGLPLADCKAAAAVALLPDCRQRHVLDTIARYVARLAEPSAEPSAPATVPLAIAANTAGNDAALARARKRRRA